MWGPHVKLWSNIERLKEYTAFDGLFVSRNHRGELVLPKESYLDYFLFDQESEKDLMIGFGRDRRREHFYSKERYDGKERMLFQNNGLMDLAHKSLDNPSSQSWVLLQQAFAIPERTTEGINERQQIFRALESSDLEKLEKMLALTGYPQQRDNYQRDAKPQAPLLDSIFGAIYGDEQKYMESYPKYLLLLKNYAGLLVELENNPELNYVYQEMTNGWPRELKSLNKFLTSSEHHITLDDKLRAESLSWNPGKPLEKIIPIELTKFIGNRDINREGDLATKASAGLAYMMYTLYTSFKENLGENVNQLALLEANLGYVKMMKKSKNLNWCYPEIVDSSKPFIELEGYVHPSYAPEGIITPQLNLGKNNLSYIITGANDAGKTQSMRGIAQIVALAHAGFPIPAKKVRMSNFGTILTNFARKDDGAKGMYKRGLERWMEVFPNAGTRSLILADEPSDATFLETGVAHSIMALNCLSEKGALSMMTTHHHEVARAVESKKIQSGANLHANAKKLPNGKIEYGRHLEEGADYISYGEEVAKAVGFTKANLARMAKNKPPVRDINETNDLNLEFARHESEGDGEEDVPF